MLQSFDIVCLCETWGSYHGEFNDFLEGYFHYDSIRPYSNTHVRNSGGVSVFVGPNVQKLNIVTRIYDYFCDCVVLLVRLSMLSNMNDLIMYFAYVSPEGSSIYSQRIENNGITGIQSNLEIIVADYSDVSLLLAGDMNARTKNLPDFIPDDRLNHIFGNIHYESGSFDSDRKSKDINRANNFGKSLIQLCCIYDVHILNGRFPGDVDGEFTCFANEGLSVVDYILISSHLFKNVKDFWVINDDRSDHFPIKCSLQIDNSHNTIGNNDQSDIIVNSNLNSTFSYRWRDILKHQFLGNL